MVRTNLRTAAAPLMLGGAAPVLAQAAPAQTPSGQPETASARPDPKEVICEKVKEMGSRLATKRVCMTRAQWDERRLLDRQELEKVQVQRGYTGGN